MVTFGDLITRNFNGPADEEAGNIASILLFPVIVPIQIVLVTGLGAYKLGKTIKEHNPIKYYRNRKESIKYMEEMASKGVNPYESRKRINWEKVKLEQETKRLNDTEKEEIISKTESILKDELSKSSLDVPSVRIDKDKETATDVMSSYIKTPDQKVSYSYKTKKLTLTRKGQ